MKNRHGSWCIICCPPDKEQRFKDARVQMNPDEAKEFKEATMMTQREMFEASFKRPKNYFQLPAQRQWEIDAELGILDWAGEDLSKEDDKRFQDHYKEKK
jgi:hypothetical protein